MGYQRRVHGIIFNPLFGFYILLGLTVIVALRATSPFILWAALEINILLFLPVIASESGLALENTIKYFFNSKLSVHYISDWMGTVLPSKGDSLIYGIFGADINNIGFMFFAISTFIVIFIRVPGTVSINKLLALSSIINLIWILLSVQIFLKLLLIFMAIYRILLLGVNIIFKTTQTSRFIEISIIRDYRKRVAVLIFISLGGMPPLLGFLGKLLVLKTSLLFFNAAFILVLVFNSLMILFSYISRSFFILTFNPPIKSSMKEVKNSIAINIYLASLFRFRFFIIIV